MLKKGQRSYRKNEQSRVFVLIAVILFLSIAAYNRNIIWHSEESLWMDTVNKSPVKAIPHDWLAESYRDLGRINEAIKEHITAISLASEFHHFFHYNFALTLKIDGRLNDAVKELLKSISYEPDYWEAYRLLGIIFIQMGRFEDAENSIKKAVEIQLKSGEPGLYNDLGNLYLMQGKYRMAISEYEKAVNIDKNNAEAIYNIASAYENIGKPDKAVEFYKKLVAINPIDYKNEVEYAKKRIRELQKK